MSADNLPPVGDLADRAMEALGLDETSRATAELWASCVLQACQQAGESVPELGVYGTSQGRWFGFQLGRRPSVSDSGLGLLQGKATIRARPAEFPFAVRKLLAAATRIIGAGGEPVWYFRLDDDGDVEMSESGRAVTERYGQTGKAAIVGAMRSVLTARTK